MALIQQAKNPSGLLQTLMLNNPQYAEVMNLVNQYGGDPKKAFYETAKARGVDPNSILSVLRGN